MEYPKTFADARGRKWTISLPWGMFRRVKEKTGIDLNGIVPKKSASEAEQQAAITRYLDLIYSPTDFPAVLFVILEAQMQAAGVSAEDLADAFDEASIDAVTKAFHQALADFIRDPQLKLPFQRVMQGVERAMAAATRKLDQAMPAMMDALEAELDQKSDELLKNTSTSSPAS